MMYASKTPEQIGCTCYWTPESMWFSHYGAVEPGSQMEPNYECFEHFPHAQRNEPNLLLGVARRAHEDGHLSDFIEGFLGDGAMTGHPMIDHARRVLSRLANLKEES